MQKRHGDAFLLNELHCLVMQHEQQHLETRRKKKPVFAFSLSSLWLSEARKPGFKLHIDFIA